MSSILTITPRERFLANLFPIPVACGAAIDKDTTCIICTADPIDDLVGADDEYAVVLHDRHVFGERCIREWLSENNTCPKCRHVLFEEDEDDYSDFDSEYDEELADDMDAEWEDDMNGELWGSELRMRTLQFSEALAEDDYQLAASMGQLDLAQLSRFRRDFCWVCDLDLEETRGGQRSEFELMEVYFDGIAFPDFDPQILPLELVTEYFEGTLPVDVGPDMMPVNSIRSLASRRVPQ